MEIQTPKAPIVHPKMKTGKEALTIPNCELRIAESATSPRSVENSPAIHGWDSWFAIFQSPARDERCLRTATIFCRPSRDFYI